MLSLNSNVGDIMQVINNVGMKRNELSMKFSPVRDSH